MSMATLLFPARRTTPEAANRSAVIDIGSNSIRLVVYQGAARLPAILFNEKVMAGLGRGLAETGRIEPESLDLAREALARFAWLAREMGARTRTVATAAVRDAANGQELIDAANRVGLTVELLSGEEEAAAAGYGVISGWPQADGIVGDLGGGSLELVRVAGGEILKRVSFPLGVLRLGAIRAKGKGALDRHVMQALEDAGWAGAGRGLPLFLVGGSWRALARLEMHLSSYPLPVIHGYAMPPETIARLVRAVPQLGKTTLKTIPNLSGARVPTLGDAGALLAALVKRLGSDTTVVSAFGLREGLLYGALPPEIRRLDPLIVAAREEGTRLGRFPEHGDLLHSWIEPLFADEPASLRRLRHAACLLADVGWQANPDFRAERGLEVALHGNWVAIDAHGRALVAQTLFTALGGGISTPAPLTQLAPWDELRRAMAWGLAIRLGQRLSGGVAAPLERTKLERDNARLLLTAEEGDRAFYGEAVERRHKALATALGLEPVLAS